MRGNATTVWDAEYGNTHAHINLTLTFLARRDKLVVQTHISAQMRLRATLRHRHHERIVRNAGFARLYIPISRLHQNKIFYFKYTTLCDIRIELFLIFNVY